MQATACLNANAASRIKNAGDSLLECERSEQNQECRRKPA